MNPEVTFPTRLMSRMTFMPVRFILDIKALRREGGAELFRDFGFDLHDGLPKGAAGSGQPVESDASLGKMFCQDLKVSVAFSHNVRS
jgi:hypothetical protein